MASYRKYDSEIKEMIIQTRNPALFPELNIPRTTALYWIKSAGKERKKTAYKESRKKQKETVANRLRQESYKLYVLSEVLKNNLKMKGKKGREKIIELFETAKKEYGVSYAQMCRLIGIHVATFKQWRIDIHGCSYNFKKCEVNTRNDLLISEKEQMIRMLRDRKFAHFSLKSLCYYAKKKRLVYASVTTWYKFMKLYNINRSNLFKRRRKNKIGPRSKRPNELWHIDVTQFKLRGGRKVYLQAIVDNYSRFIIDYEFSTSISGVKTSQLLKRAMNKHDITALMSDGGTENNNKIVKKVLVGKNVKFLISGKNTVQKNSMIEAVFAAIKRKRRDFQYETIPELVMDYVRNVIEEYNNIIPHSVLNGATPFELFNGAWGDKQVIEMKKAHQEAMSKRLEYKDPSCECYV